MKATKMQSRIWRKSSLVRSQRPWNTYIFPSKHITYMYSCKLSYKNFVPIVHLAKFDTLM